jgi:hypothetical protein
LAALNVRVLSPADPRIVAAQGEFLFVASDPIRSVRLVQSRHMDCIKASNFLWLVCPDGYVGTSASIEAGFAIRDGAPIFATRAPMDITLREYVKVVPTLADAVRIVAASPRRKRAESILINPHASVEEAHCVLDRIATLLTRPNASRDPAATLRTNLAALRTSLALPA